jgi:hypothetical protein
METVMARKTLIMAAVAALAVAFVAPAGAQFNGKYKVNAATHQLQNGSAPQAGRSNDKLRTAGPVDNWSRSGQSGQGYRVKTKFPTLPSKTKWGRPVLKQPW